MGVSLNLLHYKQIYLRNFNHQIFDFISQQKNVKISKVKRSLHLKNKKNYTKPMKKKQLATNVPKNSDKNVSTSKKVFGRPSVEKPKPKGKKKFVKNQLTVPKAANGPTAQANGHTDEAEDDEENEYEDMLDMMEEEDKAVIEGLRKTQKRKRDENDNDNARAFEKQHAHEARREASKKTRTVDLLPIKTKAGDLITRSTEVEIDDVQPDDELGSEEEDDDEDGEPIDSDDDIVNDKGVSTLLLLFGPFLFGPLGN